MNGLFFHFIYGMSSKPHWRTPSFFKMGTSHHQPVDQGDDHRFQGDNTKPTPAPGRDQRGGSRWVEHGERIHIFFLGGGLYWYQWFWLGYEWVKLIWATQNRHMLKLCGISGAWSTHCAIYLHDWKARGAWICLNFSDSLSHFVRYVSEPWYTVNTSK